VAASAQLPLGSCTEGLYRVKTKERADPPNKNANAMPSALDLEATRKRLASARYSTRQKGLQELLSAGLRDEFVRHLLHEKDVAVVSNAVGLIRPDVPPELLVHMFHVGRQPTPISAFAFYAPQHNCLYAEAAIHAHYAPQGRKLALDSVTAIGQAYLRSFAPLLDKIIARDLEIAEDAVARQGRRALVGGYHAFERDIDRPVYTQLAREWSTDSQKVFAALVAARRIDHAVPAERIAALREQVRALAPEGPGAFLAAMTTLDWVEFDSLDTHSLRSALAPGVERPRFMSLPSFIADVGTTLLKRGLADTLEALVDEGDPFRFYSTKFCHWPLTRHLEAMGRLRVEPQWLGADEYLRNRSLGIGGPPWAESVGLAGLVRTHSPPETGPS
jgi:hypothetical protein